MLSPFTSSYIGPLPSELLGPIPSAPPSLALNDARQGLVCSHLPSAGSSSSQADCHHPDAETMFLCVSSSLCASLVLGMHKLFVPVREGDLKSLEA